MHCCYEMASKYHTGNRWMSRGGHVLALIIYEACLLRQCVVLSECVIGFCVDVDRYRTVRTFFLSQYVSYSGTTVFVRW